MHYIAKKNVKIVTVQIENNTKNPVAELIKKHSHS